MRVSGRVTLALNLEEKTMPKLKSILLAGAMLFAGVAAPGAIQTYAAEPLLIGVIEDRSGSSTFYSQESAKAIKLFAGKVNKGEFMFSAEAVGTEPGILGRQIELIFEDDENNPNNTVIKARRLLERGAEVLFFLSGSGATLQGRVVCTEQKVLCIAPTNVSDALLREPNNDYIFTVNPLASITVAAHIAAWEKLGAKRVAGIADSSATSKIVGDFYRSQWEAAGMETVAYETIEVGAPDANIPMRRVMETKPDLIIDQTSSAAEAANLYRARSRLGDKTTMFGSNALGGTPHVWELAGKALDGTLIVDFVSGSNPNTQALKAVYEGEYGQNTFVGLHADVWDGLMLMKKAVEAAGSTDGTAARDELEKIADFPSAFGQPGFRHSFSKERHNGTAMNAHIILQFKDGLPSVVWDVFQP